MNIDAAWLGKCGDSIKTFKSIQQQKTQTGMNICEWKFYSNMHLFAH